MFAATPSPEEVLDTFVRDLEFAANRVAYGVDDGGVLAAAARVWLAEYEPSTDPRCSNGADRCAIYVPPRKP